MLRLQSKEEMSVLQKVEWVEESGDSLEADEVTLLVFYDISDPFIHRLCFPPIVGLLEASSWRVEVWCGGR